MGDLKIVFKKVEDLIPYINNPRHNDEAVDKVASSIKNFGFKVPIVIDKDNEIITGHTRLRASKKLGLEEVPCIVADDLTDGQIKAFRIADNKVAEFSDWDMELLNSELKELEDLDLDFDMDDFGFEFEDLDAEDVQEDDFDIDAELEKEPISKPGEIYQLGEHRLMCGDSTSEEDIQKLMGWDIQADLLVTDPPYNVNYEGNAGKIKNDHMQDDQFREFLKNAFETADSVMKKGASFYIWYADKRTYSFIGACIDVGWLVRQCLIWNKNNLVIGGQDYQWKHEPCLYGWKDGASHLWTSDRRQVTVINMDKPIKSDLHPTMKPVALFDYLIKNNTKSGDIVLDIFGGSGTTIMACQQNGRRGFVMELDPKYCDVIIKRWEEFTGEKAVKLNG